MYDPLIQKALMQDTLLPRKSATASSDGKDAEAGSPPVVANNTITYYVVRKLMPLPFIGGLVSLSSDAKIASNLTLFASKYKR
jgi:hypothetical protein